MSQLFFLNCPICSSQELSSLKKFQHAHLAKCKKCKFVFSLSIPTSEELKEHYKNYHSYSEISAITIKRYNQLLDKFEKFRKTNNIIDVGCGDGFFLDAAKKRNWNVFGTEYRQEAVDMCQAKGLNMKMGKLSDLNYPPSFFDVITSFEVIEHINNPVEEIKSFSSILRLGGCIYITTPNFNSLSRYLLGKKWNVIGYPEHLSYYTLSTLTRAFQKEGLKVGSYSVTGISIARIIKSSENAAFPITLKDEEFIRNKIEKRIFLGQLKNTINSLLTLTHTGDTLKVYFLKHA